MFGVVVLAGEVGVCLFVEWLLAVGCSFLVSVGFLCVNYVGERVLLGKS